MSILNRRGATLTELMIASAVLSVAVMGLLGSMTGIQKSFQLSKSGTLASTLGQEQMQILKQRVYYQILITTNPAYDANFSPSVPYDTGYFPPQLVLEGGINFTRYTYVQVVKEDSGVIVVLPPGTPDTGMKLVTVNVVWKVGNDWKRLSLRSIVANPDTVTASSNFTGVVRDASTMAPIPGAVVNVAENLGWRDTAGAGGSYQIGLSPGSYTLGTVVPGYFPAHVSASVGPLDTENVDFTLVPMSSGSVTGSPLWVNPFPVISQVVVSTIQADTGFQAQYVELYNPLATPFTVSAGGLPAGLKLKLVSGCSGAGNVACNGSTYGIKLDYVNDVIPAYGYYLIANTATFTVNGVLKTADAVYADDAHSSCPNMPSGTYWNTMASPPLKKLAPDGHAGTFYLTDASDVVMDAVGWNHTSGGVTNALCEGNCLNLDGAPAGEQFVRMAATNTLAAQFDSAGRAYDSGYNRVDFATTTGGLVYAAFSSADGARPLLSGKPAVGAIVSANDGLSQSTQAYASGWPVVARFALTQVATGTWTALVSSGSWSLQHDTVTVAATGSVFPLPSTMTFLDTANSDGFISGRVSDVLGNPIAPSIPVDPGGAGAVKYASTANGRYLLRVTPGLVDVVANSGVGAAANYVSVSSLGVSVPLGGIRSGVDFLLSQGGRASGFVTRDGVNPLPGVAVSLIDNDGYARDQPVSGADGRFTSLNITTGTYTASPALDSLETSSPSAPGFTVTSGGNTFIATFTVSGALGAITGSVQASGAVLRTGALIVVTTAALAGAPPAPPALSSAALTGTPYYLASSGEDGTYRVEVRQSTSPAYRVYAYYVTYPGGAPQINALSQTGVSVLAGQTVSGVDFSW